jgi:hypothetical protein
MVAGKPRNSSSVLLHTRKEAMVDCTKEITKSHFANFGDGPDFADNFAWWARDRFEETLDDLLDPENSQLLDDVVYSMQCDGHTVSSELYRDALSFLEEYEDELAEALEELRDE